MGGLKFKFRGTRSPARERLTTQGRVERASKRRRLPPSARARHRQPGLRLRGGTSTAAPPRGPAHHRDRRRARCELFPPLPARAALVHRARAARRPTSGRSPHTPRGAHAPSARLPPAPPSTGAGAPPVLPPPSPAPLRPATPPPPPPRPPAAGELYNKTEDHSPTPHPQF